MNIVGIEMILLAVIVLAPLAIMWIEPTAAEKMAAFLRVRAEAVRQSRIAYEKAHKKAYVIERKRLVQYRESATSKFRSAESKEANSPA